MKAIAVNHSILYAETMDLLKPSFNGYIYNATPLTKVRGTFSENRTERL